MSGLLIAGTTSDAGKSLVTAGLCRWFARRGVRVAPFKAQNMSNNSMVCADGAEIGRAQWLQARAARVEPEAAMNPVLLKPGSDRRSHVIALGKPYGTLEAGEYATGRAGLADIAFAAFAELRQRFDLVVCEGAGSPAEINLRSGDYVNLGLARRFSLPVLVVGDIDRGGVLAAMFGTLALLSPEDQALVAGWLVNKFRGDVGLLQPGLNSLEKVTGRPVLGVLPWLDRVWIDSEDALAAAGWRHEAAQRGLRVAVVRFPRASNATDVDALAAEPGVTVSLTADPDTVAAADLVVLPGSRATVDDLKWLRTRGLADAVTARAKAGLPVLGICGGYQMLAESIEDNVESEAGLVEGLGLLPTRVKFAEEKVLGRPVGEWRGHRVEAYEIHHGSAGSADAESFLDGYRVGSVWGTTWHGALENDGFRRAWLAEAAAQAGIEWQAVEGAPGFADLREDMLDRLADAIQSEVDTGMLLALAEAGAPGGLPFVPPGAP
ncbi:cobyric acid synthase [Amycolatopsis sp. AA4]|uniref:cobyric acid synthase n=1 Tax=Actinomycetes TaxID=1760 RepID=UPI0001B53AF7|nr:MULTISPECIES: cobyric acid synthase [Actinomycetes]ATY13928.1 cobyric acid synthase [Amycolatopsis sp. AA4]EFL09937.1 cobyric acid synthase CobQ [Streptomyces sp. AA4]